MDRFILILVILRFKGETKPDYFKKTVAELLNSEDELSDGNTFQAKSVNGKLRVAIPNEQLFSPDFAYVHIFR